MFYGILCRICWSPFVNTPFKAGSSAQRVSYRRSGVSKNQVVREIKHDFDCLTAVSVCIPARHRPEALYTSLTQRAEERDLTWQLCFHRVPASHSVHYKRNAQCSHPETPRTQQNNEKIQAESRLSADTDTVTLTVSPK